MKTNSVCRLSRFAAMCFPMLGATILVSIPFPALAQGTSSTTTTTTVQLPPVTTIVPIRLYISKEHGDSLHDGDAIYDRPNGKVYNRDGDCIGHLTNLEGADISSVPGREEFKIRSTHGNMIASTRPSSGYASDRKIMLSHNDKPAPAAASSTTMSQTTVGP